MHKSLPNDYCTIASNQVLSFLQLLKKTEAINSEAKKLRMQGIHARIKVINVWRMIE